MKSTEWVKIPVHWVDGDTAYISVVFTWQLPQVYSLCVSYREQGYRVRAGGVAVKLLPEYLSQVAETDGEINALPKHNPYATYTSRGCPYKCSFCAVSKIEGDLTELAVYEPNRIVCDNNFLACSRRHFDEVVDRLKFLNGIDFNQGLDVRELEQYHIDRLQELDLAVLRFAWDDIKSESIVMQGIEKVVRSGFPRSKIRCYVLFNFKDKLEDALYRCNTLKKMGMLPNVQRYQPLDTLIKDSHISPNWNERTLRDFGRYWSKQVWFGGFPFEEYCQHCKPSKIAKEQGVMELV